MTNRLPCFRGTFGAHGKQPPLCIWDVAQCHKVLYHVTGGLSAYLGNRTIYHRVMACGVELGGNPAVYASDAILASPALFASHGSAAPHFVAAVLAW